MDTADNPFDPRTPLTRDQLERYIRGRTGPEECHEVERHLEADPLLREAVEGLMLPGALAAAQAQRRPPTLRMRPGRSLLLVACFLGGAFLAWWLKRPQTPAPLPPVAHVQPAPVSVPAVVESTLAVVDAELNAVPDVRVQASAEAPAAERFRVEPVATSRVDRTAVERVSAHTTQLDRDHGKPGPLDHQGPRSSRQLLYLHGMKVVHPDELRRPGSGPLPSPGRSADTEAARRDSIPSGPSALPYLTLMDRALTSLAKGADRNALTGFYQVLAQYPDDVNAQFYAGLACYRSGLYPRALGHLQAAATNTVDSFQEEARWYVALTTERTEGPQAAHPLFERIARQGGFYAEQAKRLTE